MKYKSFYEYAQDRCWERVKPRDRWGSRFVLKINGDSLTHIGDIRIEGSLTQEEHSWDFCVQRRLLRLINKPFKGLVSDDPIYPQYSLRMIPKANVSDSVKWVLEVRASAGWNWRLFSQWNLVKVPKTVVGDDVNISISKVDFNVKKIGKRDMPDHIIRNIWYDIQKPEFWLSDLGGLHLNENEEWKKGRVGLKRRAFKRVDNFWDVPSDNTSVPHCLKYSLGKSGWAFCLPFISVYATHSENNFAMGFSGDDFLPNPQKRRDLFNLVKKSDSNLLDTHFDKQRVFQWSWGNKKDVWKSDLVGRTMTLLDRRWLKVKAITAHQPNSVLGSILVDGDQHLIEFTLKYFKITAAELNQLQVGRCYVVEILARIGRLSLVSRLVQGELKLSGKVRFNGKHSFQRTWSVVFAALEVDNVEYLKAAVALDQKWKLLKLRTHRGVTALGVAVMGNKIEHVRILIEAVADVNQSSWGDETALCLGLQFGVSLEIIEELVRAGANTFGNDLTGNSIRSQLEARRLVG